MRQKIDGILQVRDQIDQFIENAAKEIDIEAVIVFGSRATGENLESSDLDLLAVSDFFEGMAPFRRTELLLAFWEGDIAIDPLGFTPKELMSAESLIVLDLLEFGKPIVDRGTFSKARENFNMKKMQGVIRQIPGGWKHV